MSSLFKDFLKNNIQINSIFRKNPQNELSYITKLVAIFPKKWYIIYMDIQSVEMNQEIVQEQAAVQAQATEHDAQRQQAQAGDSQNATVETDPTLGQNVDLTA